MKKLYVSVLDVDATGGDAVAFSWDRDEAIRTHSLIVEQYGMNHTVTWYEMDMQAGPDSPTLDIWSELRQIFENTQFPDFPNISLTLD